MLPDNVLKRVAGFASPARIQVACCQQSKWVAQGTVEFRSNGDVVVKMGGEWGGYMFELGVQPAEVSVFGVSGLMCTARNPGMHMLKPEHDFTQVGVWRICDVQDSVADAMSVHGAPGFYRGVSDVLVEQCSSINLLL
jgi:hypothetical protein